MFAVAALVCAIALATGATGSKAAQGSGALTGRTLITFGCPGPARLGIACPRWHLFPHSRLAIRQVGPGGQPPPQIVRLVVSDANARFSVRISSGDYLLRPLAQRHTHGGKSITVHLAARVTTRVTVRFIGYP
jgi:hypothetical protein